MNILVAVDDNYVRPLFIMLESLFSHEKRKMNIYLFYSNVSKLNRNRLRVYIENQGSCFTPICVDKSTFQDAPCFRYFTRETYYRFLCTKLLPETEERVLYLDPDILIRGEISPLYEMDFLGKSLIAVEDQYTKYKRTLGFAEEEPYINAGVLLLNLEKMRKDFVLQDAIRIIDEYRDNLYFLDQDVLNIYFKGDIRLVEDIYNYNTFYHGIGKMLQHLLGKREKEPVIVHYMGASKPWQVDYYWKYFFEYFSYLKKYLNRKEKILFMFKPCYVFAKMVKDFFRLIRKNFVH